MPQQNNFYSSETQDIMGKMPHWIIRWGISVIFVIFAGIVFGCWFIKYPQSVVAPVVITTLNPPADLVTRYEGRIDSIYVTDGQTVFPGSVVAVLYNTADYKAVKEVEQNLTASYKEPDFKTIVSQPWLAQEYLLGDIQTTYAEFRRMCADYSHYLNTDYIGKKKMLLEQQIAKSAQHYGQLKQQQLFYKEEMKLEEKGMLRDSILYQQKIISALDYESATQERLQKKKSEVGFDANLTTTELGIMQSRQQLIELSIQQDNEIAQYERNLSQYRQQLINQINSWKETYLLASPIEGKITFINYWSINQRIKNGERLASVVPAEAMQVIGRASIPSSGFGKVETGQTVNVKLNGYPYMEFGVLKGTIKSISAVPDGENGYIAEVTFPLGLTTTYKKELLLIQQMDGTAEIITKEMRLIQRYLQPIRALFDK